MKRFFTAAICFLTFTASFSADAADCRISILHFNDFHGFLEAPKGALGGGAELAGLINKISTANEKEGRETILLFGGDLMSGTPVSEKYKGKAEFEFLNMLNVQAMVVGNHDFDFGISALKDNMKIANFTALAANIIDKKNERLFAEASFVVSTESGCKIGIMGLTAANTPSMTGGDVSTLKFENPITYAGYYIDDLVEQSDLKIALTHLDRSDDIKLAKTVAQLDLVIGGHDHVRPADYCINVGKIPVCETPPNGQYLGKIDIDVTGGKVIIKGKELIHVKGGKIWTPKPVKELLKRYQSAISASMEKVVFKLNKKLYYRPKEGTPEASKLGKYVASAMKAETGADIAFMNSGGLRRDLKKGGVTYNDVFEAIPFQNYVVVTELTGDDILKLIRRSEGMKTAERTDPLHWAGIDIKKKNMAHMT